MRTPGTVRLVGWGPLEWAAAVSETQGALVVELKKSWGEFTPGLRVERKSMALSVLINE